MSGIAVVIIVKNRYAALCGTMAGLADGLVLPQELIIVNMNQQAAQLPAMPFPVQQTVIYAAADLPLATARNRGMAIAHQERVVFLDVDCIPAPDLLASYLENWQDDHLLSGQVRYLPADFDARVIPENLLAVSTADPIRSGLAKISYELFWSLNFGCNKALFRQIGGFDENFQGYGAEDTDFAFAARKNNVPISNIAATAYHQYHPSYAPPMNHLADIVTNANLFYRKWQVWPMEGWLEKFELAGLISRKQDTLHLLRLPARQELQEALKG